MAKVTRATAGEDGVVRSVTLKAGNKTYTRPVCKVCLLEGAEETMMSKEVHHTRADSA